VRSVTGPARAGGGHHRHHRHGHRGGGHQATQPATQEPHAVETADPFGVVEHQGGEQEPREGEEGGDAEVAAPSPPRPGVEGDDRRHGDASQPVEFRERLLRGRNGGRRLSS
jgi:hypothetical protein